MTQRLAVTVLISLLCVANRSAKATVFQIYSPAEITGSSTTLNFDGYEDLTSAGTLYPGMVFSRDDGAGVFLQDWSALGRTTASPGNVLATLAGPSDLNWATHLNVFLTVPVFQFGAYFGNDQGLPFFPAGDFSVIRLSAFDLSGHLLGSVSLSANQNTSVDQFIGLGSNIAFSQLRFENLSDGGGSSQNYAVVLDDVVFSQSTAVMPIPEPSTAALLGLGLACLSKLCRDRRKG